MPCLSADVEDRLDEVRLSTTEGEHKGKKVSKYRSIRVFEKFVNLYKRSDK